MTVLARDLVAERSVRWVNQHNFPDRYTACPACDGDRRCPLCLGTGQVTNATARVLRAGRNQRRAR